MIGADGAWTRFTHPILGLAIDHPLGWQTLQDQFGSALVVLAPHPEPVPFRANMTVSVERHEDDATLDRFVGEQEKRAAVVLTDLAFTERAETTVAGEPARRVRGRYRQGRLDIELEQWHFFVGPAAVTVSAAAEASAWHDLCGTFERIASSVMPAREAS